MVEFYLNDKDKEIYKKTDYLCNEKEKTMYMVTLMQTILEKYMME